MLVSAPRGFMRCMYIVHMCIYARNVVIRERDRVKRLAPRANRDINNRNDEF